MIYSITLPALPIPVICLLIPGVSHGNHMQRVQFWERNLSQIGTVMSTTPIGKEKKSQQIQIQKAYEDILAKFHEVNFLMNISIQLLLSLPDSSILSKSSNSILRMECRVYSRT